MSLGASFEASYAQAMHVGHKLLLPVDQDEELDSANKNYFFVVVVWLVG